MPATMVGKSILEKHGKSEANEAVLAELKQRGALLHQEKYTHSYPHCWRSKTPVIFRAMDQWFIAIDHAGFRQRALEEINRVSWIPDWGKSRIESAVAGRPDWCISRQRTWGVPIPVFYDAQGTPILDARIVRAAADLFQKHGSNAWYEKPVDELWAALKPPGWTGPEASSKSLDTLDVWIDSGSSSRSVIATRPELRGEDKPFQCDMYLEGSDQHRGWFQSSLLLSLAGNGAAPFRTVLTHGFMVDEDREKISKSKQGQGGYEKPQTSDAYIKKYGADVVRLWVSSQDFRNDVVVSESRMEKVAESYRMIRNALRYQLSNLFDFDPAQHSVPDANLTGLDRWILDEYAALERDVAIAYERSEFHAVYQKLTQFIAVELSAVYHDVVKDRLYTDAAGSLRRRSTQTVLYRIVTQLCKMLSPILVFTADEAWEFLPGDKEASVHEAEWQPTRFERSSEERSTWKNLFELRDLALLSLEKARQEKQIGKALEAAFTFIGPASALSSARDNEAALRELLNVSQVGFRMNGSDGPLQGEVSRAQGKKCERCWHWETDVGVNPAHPTICGRCVEAVNGSSSQPQKKLTEAREDREG
jgi:isoleucyl-tRNA synthetase